MITKKRHMKQLQDNLQILDSIVSDPDTIYPGLRELFILKSGPNKGKPNALYCKLVNLHHYVLHYEDDGEKKMEDAGRGWEWFASQQTLVDNYGSNKNTWKRAIRKLYFMGLIGIYNPVDGREFNTPGQQYSAERAKQGMALSGLKAALIQNGFPADAVEKYMDDLSCRPCTWYRIHHYTEKLLDRAEALAPLVKAGYATDKDSMRDVGGKEFANLITDTGYDIHPNTELRRTLLGLELVTQLLENRGYTTSKNVLDAFTDKGLSFGSKQRWLETWKSYKPYLFDERKLKESRPTNAEKERWGLAGDGWIIRYK